jgi:GNAT superfamily N-acetyltransferase
LSNLDEEHKPSIAPSELAQRAAARDWVRPSTPEDAAAIVELMSAAGLQPHSDTRFLHWKYWRERLDYPGPRSFVMTDGHKLLAHLAVVPGAFRYGDTRARVTHMIDWAARREAAGAGIRLAKHVARMSDFALATGGSEHTRRIFPMIGYVECGTISGYTRTLSPLDILHRPIPSRWKLLPRMVRSFLWSLAAPRPDTAGWQARRIEMDEIDRMDLPIPTPVPGKVVFERTPALFRHVLACPIVPTELYGLVRGGRIGGYFLLSYAPGQARIVDMWMASEDPADWRALVHAAVSQARRREGLAELIVWSSDPGLSQILDDCGFHERLSLPISLRPPEGTAIPHDIMRVQMLDSDAFYLHLDGNELWA